MNVVIPFHNGDAHLAIDLVKWIGQLGGIGDGQLFIITDSAIKEEHLVSIRQALTGIPPETNWVVNSDWTAVIGWPQGSNSLLRMALSGLGGRIKGHWIWLEPDAIPLKRGWLDAIRKEYAACGKRYMGNVYVCDNPQLPNRLMSGIGVYPADAKEELEHFTTTQYAWDVEAARFLVENCAHTKLIHHFWGIMGMPPTFAAARTPESQPNTFTLESIHKDAVIFHRNKDGTLLELLKRLNSMTVPIPEVETLAPIKNDAELIAKIRSSVEDW